MKELLICIKPGSNEVYCIGHRVECAKYLKQLESIDEESVEFIKINEIQLMMYEGYELIYLSDCDLILTQGEMQMLTTTCKEEQSSLKLVDEELNRLQNSEMFSEDVKYDIKDFMEVVDRMKRQQAKYLSENILFNIDIDALRYAYNMERENKGEPTMFIH